MAEEPAVSALPPANSTEPEVTDQGFAPPTDWLLQRFVRLINATSKGEMGVTLLIGGSLISGQLISGRAYIGALAEQFVERLVDPGVGESMGEFVRMAGSVYLGSQDGSVPDPVFIHLRDAKVFHPSGHSIPTNEGVLWRGRISHIEGFFFGQMSSSLASGSDADDSSGAVEDASSSRDRT
jgi:hypothetical protein